MPTSSRSVAARPGEGRFNAAGHVPHGGDGRCDLLCVKAFGQMDIMNRLRNWLVSVTTALSLLLFLGTAAMWARSHVSTDVGYWRSARHSGGYTSTGGRLVIVFCSYEARSSIPTTLRIGSAPDIYQSGGTHANVLGFDARVWDVSGWGLDGPDLHEIVFPYWFFALLFAILPAIWLRRFRRRIPPGHCRSCGYDLRASRESCPECGSEIPASHQHGMNLSA